MCYTIVVIISFSTWSIIALFCITVLVVINYVVSSYVHYSVDSDLDDDLLDSPFNSLF